MSLPSPEEIGCVARDLYWIAGIGIRNHIRSHVRLLDKYGLPSEERRMETPAVSGVEAVIFGAVWRILNESV